MREKRVFCFLLFFRVSRFGFFLSSVRERAKRLKKEEERSIRFSSLECYHKKINFQTFSSVREGERERKRQKEKEQRRKETS